VKSPETNSPVSIRQGTPADLGEILRQRRGMYEDMNYTDAEALDSNGSFRSWLGVMDGTIVGGGAVLISPWPCHPYDASCRRATILNVYAYPQYRRKGVARALMHAILEWCRSEGFAVVFLHASDDGRPLYESLGFEPTNEMRLKF
jgi:GNAT superfamily N-acetyltransferase